MLRCLARLCSVHNFLSVSNPHKIKRLRNFAIQSLPPPDPYYRQRCFRSHKFATETAQSATPPMNRRNPPKAKKIKTIPVIQTKQRLIPQKISHSTRERPANAPSTNRHQTRISPTFAKPLLHTLHNILCISCQKPCMLWPCYFTFIRNAVSMVTLPRASAQTATGSLASIKMRGVIC